MIAPPRRLCLLAQTSAKGFGNIYVQTEEFGYSWEPATIFHAWAQARYSLRPGVARHGTVVWLFVSILCMEDSDG